jgi:hypothetical protein
VAALKPKGAAYGPVLLSILAVFSLVLLTPVVMGGTIGLALQMEGEKLNRESPDDVNGIGPYYLPFGICDEWTGSSGVTITSTAVVVVQSLNWTATNQIVPTANSPGSQGNCSNTTVNGPYGIRIPAGVLVSPDVISRFALEVWGTSYCSSLTYCDNGWRFDWSILVNGSRAFGADDVKSPSMKYIGTSHYQYLTINYSMDAFDGLTLGSLMNDCGANKTSGGSCNVTVRFDNLRVDPDDSSTTYQIVPFFKPARWRIMTYDTAADTASLLLRGSAVLLSVVYLGVAVASTPLWNPLRTLQFGWG